MKKLSFLLILSLTLQFANAQGIKRKAFMGVKTTELSDSIIKALKLQQANGVLVTEVKPKSTGEAMQLQPNDVIMKVNSTITLNNKEFLLAVKSFKENDTVVMLVTRKKKS